MFDAVVQATYGQLWPVEKPASTTSLKHQLTTLFYCAVIYDDIVDWWIM